MRHILASGLVGIAGASATAVLFLVTRVLRRSRRSRMAAVSIGVALATLIGTGTAAFADSSTYSGWTYQSIEECAHLVTQINNTQGLPNLFTFGNEYIWSFQYGDCGAPGCADAICEPNNEVVRQDLFWWDADYSEWFDCNAGPWVGNPNGSNQASTGFSWSYPPCGPGYYFGNGASFAYDYTSRSYKGGWRNPWYIYVS